MMTSTSNFDKRFWPLLHDRRVCAKKRRSCRREQAVRRIDPILNSKSAGRCGFALARKAASRPDAFTGPPKYGLCGTIIDR
jgi:hypothetical protein